MGNVGKSLGFGKGQKTKGVPNKGSTTKSTPNQPNATEAWFSRLEALLTSMASNMVAHVKPIALMPNDYLA
jgi:hypothetical protein